MKRPIIEYVLIGVGFIICIASLITATLDLGPYWVSLVFSLLALLPFCLPWQGSKRPVIFLFFLIPPIYFSFIAFPQLMHIHQALNNGEKVFAGLPSLLLVGFWNMHLLIVGTVILTAYALSQTIKGRTSRLTQSPTAFGFRG